VDPSGSYWAWKASAIGKNATNAKTFLEKRYLSHPDMELEDAINTAILTLKEGFEGTSCGTTPTRRLCPLSFSSHVWLSGAMNETNIEIGVIGKDKKKFEVLSPERVAEYLAEVE
jgi:20S proteasome subunit alpha 2